MRMRPKITVITASKNGVRFLRETIDSVLKQSFTDYEHVIVDSASTDGTIEILKEYKHIRWISEPDRDVDEGFYKAMTMARGEYIMFCCVSDGYLDRDWFKKCVEVLDNDPDVSLVYGTAQNMTKDEKLGENSRPNFFNYPPQQKMDFFPFWLGTFCLCPEMTFCVRADVFRECFPKHEFTGYFLQDHLIFSFNYNFNTKGYIPYFLPVFASFCRSHHDSCSIRLAKEIRAMKRQYKSAIVKYGNELLSGKKIHHFRDGNSNIIKAIEPDELKLYRQKVLDYRINRKFYLGKKRTGGLHYWIRKFKILIGYFLNRGRIYN